MLCSHEIWVRIVKFAHRRTPQGQVEGERRDKGYTRVERTRTPRGAARPVWKRRRREAKLCRQTKADAAAPKRREGGKPTEIGVANGARVSRVMNRGACEPTIRQETTRL